MRALRPSIATSSAGESTSAAPKPLNPGIDARLRQQQGREPDAERPARSPDDHRLAQHQREHERAREAERLQHRDLLAPLADRHAHRVGAHREDRERDGEADAVQDEREVADERQEPGEELALGLRLRLGVAVLEGLVDLPSPSRPPGPGSRFACSTCPTVARCRSSIRGGTSSGRASCSPLWFGYRWWSTR